MIGVSHEGKRKQTCNFVPWSGKQPLGSSLLKNRIEFSVGTIVISEARSYVFKQIHFLVTTGSVAVRGLWVRGLSPAGRLIA